MGAAVPALVVLCRKDASGVTTDQTSRGATPLVVVATDRSTRQNATRPTDQSGAWLLLLLVNNNTFNVWRTVNKDVSTNANIPSPRHATPGRLISWHYQNSTDRPGHQGSKGEERKKNLADPCRNEQRGRWWWWPGGSGSRRNVWLTARQVPYRLPVRFSASAPNGRGGLRRRHPFNQGKGVCRLSAVYARPEF